MHIDTKTIEGTQRLLENCDWERCACRVLFDDPSDFRSHQSKPLANTADHAVLVTSGFVHFRENE